MGENEITAEVMRRTQRPHVASVRLSGWGRSLLLSACFQIFEPRSSVGSPTMRTSYRSLAKGPKQKRLQKGMEAG